MRDTKLKRMENYLYLSVALPLKGIVTEVDGGPSPIRSENGRVSFYVENDAVGGFRRNYQRDRAVHSGNKLIMGQSHFPVLVGKYKRHNHSIELYTKSFQDLGIPFVISRLCKVLNETPPFGKVKLLESAPERLEVYPQEYDDDDYGDDV